MRNLIPRMSEIWRDDGPRLRDPPAWPRAVLFRIRSNSGGLGRVVDRAVETSRRTIARRLRERHSAARNVSRRIESWHAPLLHVEASGAYEPDLFACRTAGSSDGRCRARDGETTCAKSRYACAIRQGPPNQGEPPTALRLASLAQGEDAVLQQPFDSGRKLPRPSLRGRGIAGYWIQVAFLRQSSFFFSSFEKSPSKRCAN